MPPKVCTCCGKIPLSVKESHRGGLVKYKGDYLCADCLLSDSVQDELEFVLNLMVVTNYSTEPCRGGPVAKKPSIHWPLDHNDASYRDLAFG